MGRQPNRGQVAALATAVVVLLGGGGAGAGYYLHGAPQGTASTVEAFPMERGVAMEKWQAAEAALRVRDREERAEMLHALQESTSTNISLRGAVVGLTERLGAIDDRLRAVETNTRPASYRR